MRIDKKNVVLQLEFDNTTHHVVIPCLPYSMFQDCILIFGYIYENFINGKITSLTFREDCEIWALKACEVLSSDADSKKILVNKFHDFMDKSLLGAVVLVVNDEIPLHVFIEKHKENEYIEDFFNNIRSSFLFFYATYRYATGKMRDFFGDMVSSLSIMELKNSFMNSTSQKTSMQKTSMELKKPKISTQTT